jgi:hypothetical protein
MTTLDIATPQLRVSIAPALGGSVPRFDWLGSSEPQPLFRPWDGTPAARSTGCMPLRRRHRGRRQVLAARR